MKTAGTNEAVTVWKRGRLDARTAPAEVLFGRMYEDSAIEQAAFKDRSRVFCIASAGCTAMALAPQHEVVAVDINPRQLAYAQRRLDGAPAIRGRAEQLMSFARFFAPLAGWWPSAVQEFVNLEDPERQMAYWRDRLDTWRFRRSWDLLFSVVTLRAAYSPQLLDLLPRRFGSVMRGRMERCFSRHPNRSNPYVRALLLGELPEQPVAPAAGLVRLVESDAAEFLESAPAGSFDGFSLSNILDGPGPAYRARLTRAVQHAAAPGATAVLRSFGTADSACSADRAADDRSMLWGSVWVGPAADL